MAATSEWDELIQQVIALTREHAVEHFLALYAWGGALTGETDPWSDLDVCLVLADAPKDEPTLAKDWKLSICDEFEPRVDPSAVLMEQLSADAHWRYAGYQFGLRRTGRLLLGTDIRGQIADPTARKLCLSTVNLAFLCLRRLYSVSRDKPMPDPLPPPDPRLALYLPASGNVAWQIVTALLQILRTLLALDGVFVETKRQIGPALREAGRLELADWCDRAQALRKTVSRTDEMDEIPPAVQSLAEALPDLFRQLLNEMSSRGLKDPSYEPKDGGGFYRPDGTLITEIDERLEK
jgi:predicted nucleotidyltransferase